MLPEGGKIQLVEDEVFKCLLQVSLTDEKSALHSAVEHDALHILLPGRDSQKNGAFRRGQVQTLSVEEAQKNYLEQNEAEVNSLFFRVKKAQLVISDCPL